MDPNSNKEGPQERKGKRRLSVSFLESFPSAWDSPREVFSHGDLANYGTPDSRSNLSPLRTSLKGPPPPKEDDKKGEVKFFQDDELDVISISSMPPSPEPRPVAPPISPELLFVGASCEVVSEDERRDYKNFLPSEGNGGVIGQRAVITSTQIPYLDLGDLSRRSAKQQP